MTISTYQVQNILRSYGKMLGRKQAAARSPEAAQAQTPLDKVDISSGAKRRQVINKIAQEIIGQVTSQPHGKNPIERDALGQLTQEYGKPLEVFRNTDGSLRFAVVDPGAKNIVDELSPEENQRLGERFTEIARSIVDQNMIT